MDMIIIICCKYINIKNQMKKFSAKDKNNVTKIIEEIEFNQLIY